jgi:hypothetical protein
LNLNKKKSGAAGGKKSALCPAAQVAAQWTLTLTSFSLTLFFVGGSKREEAKKKQVHTQAVLGGEETTGNENTKVLGPG